MSPEKKRSRIAIEEIKERRRQKAIQAKQAGEFKTLTEASKAFRVSIDTLRKRQAGRNPVIRSIKRSKLSSLEEYAIVEWILVRINRGRPTSRSEVEEMVKDVSRERDTETKAETKVGKNWLKSLVDNCKDLSLDVLPGYVTQKVPIISSKDLNFWLEFISYEKTTNNIREIDIYKLNICGFEMGSMGEKTMGTIVPRADRWVSILECVSSGGKRLDPFFAFIGDTRADWSEFYQDTGVKSQHFQHDADNTDFVRAWLDTIFASHVHREGFARQCILLIDGYNGVETSRVSEACEQRSVIHFVSPKGSWHLFRALDISNYRPLRSFYEKQMSIRLDQINDTFKENLMIEYRTVREKVLTSKKIRSSFKESGIAPMNKTMIMEKLSKS